MQVDRIFQPLLPQFELAGGAAKKSNLPPANSMENRGQQSQKLQFLLDEEMWVKDRSFQIKNYTPTPPASI